MYTLLTIEKPIWSSESVGIAQGKLISGNKMAISIAYRDKQGNLTYPGFYVMDADKIREYPTQQVKGGVVLHIVPIRDFEKQ